MHDMININIYYCTVIDIFPGSCGDKCFPHVPKPIWLQLKKSVAYSAASSDPLKVIMASYQNSQEVIHPKLSLLHFKKSNCNTMLLFGDDL